LKYLEIIVGVCSMNKIIDLHDKNARVEITRSAQRAIDNLTQALVAEIHLVLGCLVVKRVWFKDRADADAVPVLGNLSACFRAVRYSKSCRIFHIDSGLETPTDFPLVADKKCFVPHWVRIDFRGGRLVGEFGYDPDVALATSRMLQHGFGRAIADL